MSSDVEGSTDDDESGGDDDDASGDHSRDDGLDLSALADLTIRDVSDSFALWFACLTTRCMQFEIHQFLQVDPNAMIPETHSLFDESFASVSGGKAWNRLKMVRRRISGACCIYS